MRLGLDAYGFDGSGRLAVWCSGQRVLCYEHSCDGQVLRAGETVFAHDPRGRLALAQAPSGLVRYAHDAHGRRESGGTVRYAWSAEGRLASWTDGRRSWHASYDRTGRLDRVVASEDGRVSEERSYVFDGLDLTRFEVLSDRRVLSVEYERREGRLAGLRAGLPGGGERVFGVASTARGDVLELLDASGSVCAAYRYGPWGEPAGLLATPDAALVAAVQPLRWCGYLWEPDCAHYLLGMRWYDPATCRFLSPDPVRADGEDDPYAYCCGDPLDRSDPSGLWGTKVHLTLTREWAMEAGFPEDQAEEIARWDYEADHLFPGHRFRFVHHHYLALGARRTARRYLAEALRDGSLRALGFALHSAQDSVGHGVLGPVAHVFHRNIDVWEARPESKRRATKAASMELLRTYLDSRGSDELGPAVPPEDEQDAKVDEDVQRDGGQDAARGDVEEAEPEA